MGRTVLACSRVRRFRGHVPTLLQAADWPLMIRSVTVSPRTGDEMPDEEHSLTSWNMIAAGGMTEAGDRTIIQMAGRFRMQTSGSPERDHRPATEWPQG